MLTEGWCKLQTIVHWKIANNRPLEDTVAKTNIPCLHSAVKVHCSLLQSYVQQQTDAFLHNSGLPSLAACVFLWKTLYPFKNCYNFYTV